MEVADYSRENASRKLVGQMWQHDSLSGAEAARLACPGQLFARATLPWGDSVGKGPGASKLRVLLLPDKLHPIVLLSDFPVFVIEPARESGCGEAGRIHGKINLDRVHYLDLIIPLVLTALWRQVGKNKSHCQRPGLVGAEHLGREFWDS